MTQSPLIFRKGLDLKHEVAQVLAESYHSELVAAIKESDYRFESGRLTLYSPANSVSATGWTAPVTTPIRRESDFPIAPST